MTDKALRRILVVGDVARALFTGALLAKRCRVAGCEVVVIPSADECADKAVLLRPETLRYFHDLEVDPAKLVDGKVGVPAFSTEVSVGAKAYHVPFSPYGPARDGVEFHQLWMRWSLAGGSRKLEDFSPAIAVDQSGSPLSWQSAVSLGQDFGLLLQRQSFVAALHQLAGMCGVVVEKPASVRVEAQPADNWPLSAADSTQSWDADFLIDVSDLGAAASSPQVEDGGWTDRRLWLPNRSGLAGMEFGSLYASLALFLTLLPNRTGSCPERAEFNRIYHHRMDRIEDMATLLAMDSRSIEGCPALARKIEVFGACGRIPLEDYEVFASCEWVAVLRACGHVPARYDRLADRLPDVELHRWMEHLAGQVDKLKAQLKGVAA